MTQTQEFSGKDIDVAIENACSALTLSKDELKYDVISEGTSGIFGIVGRKEAKIRVTLPKNSEEKSAARQLAKEGISSIVDEAFGVETRVKKQQPQDTPQDTPQEEPSREAADVTQESIELGVQAIQKMADLITEDAVVRADTKNDILTLKIEGGNSGILIGRKGQTLDAMQFLADKMINRKSEDRVRVRVDIEGYMETRRENLEQLAFKMADKAKKTGRPATINQMSAQDRRIVHLALKNDSQVRTQSMGDGYYRRLVIFPKKKNSYKGKKRYNR